MKFGFENFSPSLPEEYGPDLPPAGIRKRGKEGDKRPSSLDRNVRRFFEQGKEQFPERIREFAASLTEKEAILFQDYATKLSKLKFNEQAAEKDYEASQNLINIVRTIQYKLKGRDIVELAKKDPEQIEAYIYKL